MARLLILLILVALVVLMVRAVYRRANREAAESAAQGEYRVLEQISEGEAQVLISRGPADTVLIGSVPVADEDFGDRYADLIVTAEDRAATLNASRHLHSGP